MMFHDVGLSHEYDGIPENPKSLKFLSNVSSEEIAKTIGASMEKVEGARPFVSEDIWNLAFVHLFVLSRTNWLLLKQSGEGAIRSWYEDKSVRDMLGAVFKPGELRHWESLA